ncbi:adenosylcobinamide-GDP ribazoletransferase, partial [Archaeoglobales archaeon]
MKNLISFFSRIPIRGDIERAREEIWLLPLLGFVTSAIPSLIIYFGLPLKGVISVLCLYMIIGIIHLDGTADFFDGVMARGEKAEKIRVMKSPDIGVAGVFAVVMILIIQVYSLNILPFWALISAEINSKMSMILMLSKKTPLGEGMGKFFMEKMNNRKMFLSALVYLVCIITISLTTSIITILLSLSLLVSLYVANTSIKNFGGINGDCIGAAAELTRVSSLLISVGV